MCPTLQCLCAVIVKLLVHWLIAERMGTESTVPVGQQIRLGSSHQSGSCTATVPMPTAAAAAAGIMHAGGLSSGERTSSLPVACCLDQLQVDAVVTRAAAAAADIRRDDAVCCVQ